jgi:hypothetical protein
VAVSVSSFTPTTWEGLTSSVFSIDLADAGGRRFSFLQNECEFQFDLQGL